jgi:hypothetical protein
MNEAYDKDSASDDDETAGVEFPLQTASITLSEENASDTAEGERQESTNIIRDPCPENVVTQIAGDRSWRFGVVSVLVVMGWAVLVTRLIQLQGAQQQLMNDRVTRQSVFSEVIPARPGACDDDSLRKFVRRSE